MKSPRDQKIIQIDITNACPHRCSNCTRFCGHHRKPFMMDFPTFHKAVASLEDYPGMVGIMGGEPTLHPRFERFVRHARRRLKVHPDPTAATVPIDNLAEYRQLELSNPRQRLGLWTSLGPGYYRHYELIQETFRYQCINDHRHSGQHQALLISRKDLNIPDAQWFPLRDACWIQNRWSAAITPKGAFFCEVAAALDMLFNGPGGWSIEPGWWKRTPDQFGAQLQWCELCSAPLHVPFRMATDEIDDISPTLAQRLAAIRSPKYANGHTSIFMPSAVKPAASPDISSYEPYLPEGNNRLRIADTNHSLRPKQFDAIVICSSQTSTPPVPSIRGWGIFDSITLAGRSITSAPAEQHILIHPLSGEHLLPDDLHAILTHHGTSDWIVMLREDTILGPGFNETIRQWVLNPGCLYEIPISVTAAGSGHSLARLALCPDLPNTLALIFNRRALALRKGLSAETGSDSTEQTLSWFSARWKPEKRIDLRHVVTTGGGLQAQRETAHQIKQHVISMWQAIITISPHTALFGAGLHTQWLLAVIRELDMPCPTVIFDDAPHAEYMDGIPIRKPDTTTNCTAIVISADPGPITQILTARAETLWQGRIPVIKLYRQITDSPFLRTLQESAPADKNVSHAA